MRIVAMGGQALVHGLNLAGVAGFEVEPGLGADERFDRVAADGEVAVIIVSRRLYTHLRDRIGRLRAAGPLPVVVPLPDRGEDLTPESVSSLLEDFLGVKV